jgi:transcriptional regulator with XRE-family HTH domain
MSTVDTKTSEWLEDPEIRLEYGSETLKYDVAAALVAARKMKNLTQTALAKIAGVSQAYIAKLESGEANPTIGHIGAILASIWLKAEINLSPLISSFDAEIAEPTNDAKETNSGISAKANSEIEQWIQRQMQHIEQQVNQFSQSGNINIKSSTINVHHIKLSQPANIEASSGLAKAIQPTVVTPESGINSSSIGTVDAPLRLIS